MISTRQYWGRRCVISTRRFLAGRTRFLLARLSWFELPVALRKYVNRSQTCVVVAWRPVRSAVRDGEHVAIATCERSSTSESFAKPQMCGVCIVGRTVPGTSVHASCGRRSSTAIMRTSVAAAAAPKTTNSAAIVGRSETVHTLKREGARFTHAVEKGSTRRVLTFGIGPT